MYFLYTQDIKKFIITYIRRNTAAAPSGRLRGMISLNHMIVTTIKDEAVNMDEVVTRRILADEFLKFEERFEIKMERMIDIKINEKFDQRFEEQEKRFERYVGALAEDVRHQTQMIAESLMIQTEVNERKWQEFTALYGLHDKRISKLESEVLIA